MDSTALPSFIIVIQAKESNLLRLNPCLGEAKLTVESLRKRCEDGKGYETTFLSSCHLHLAFRCCVGPSRAEDWEEDGLCVSSFGS